MGELAGIAASEVGARRRCAGSEAWLRCRAWVEEEAGEEGLGFRAFAPRFPMPLTLRRTNEDPPSYRVKYDGVEIGSISKKNHHVEHRDFWLWAVDTMPMMSHGGQPPHGEARNFDQAKKLFHQAFEKWRAGLPAGQFEENLIYKRAAVARWTTT